MVTDIGAIRTPSSVDCTSSSGRLRPHCRQLEFECEFPNPHSPLLPILLHSLSFSFLLQTMHIIIIVHSFRPFFPPILYTNSFIHPATYPTTLPSTHPRGCIYEYSTNQKI